MNFLLKSQDIFNQMETLQEFHCKFSKYFQTRTKSMTQTALHYLKGCHHHTAMVMLAMLFLVTLKTAVKEKVEKMSLKDALWIVEGLIPRRHLTYEKRVEIIAENNRNRGQSR